MAKKRGGTSPARPDDVPTPPPAPTLDASIGAAKHRTGNFTIEWTNSDPQKATLRVTHDDEPTRALFESIAGTSFVMGALGEARFEDHRGSFTVRDERRSACTHQVIDHVATSADTVTFAGRLLPSRESNDDCAFGFSLAFTAVAAHQLRFELELTPDAARGTTARAGDFRASLSYASDADEHFFGFGEQFTYFDLKGRTVPILVQEGGIGRGTQPLTYLLNSTAGVGGSASSTYAAVPQYITSHMRSLFLENSEYSVFDLRAADRVTIDVFSRSVRGRILHGRDPQAILEEYTTYAGRMRPLPDWINEGAIIGMQGGTQKVQAALAKLDDAGVPVAAFWLQDWVGKRQTKIGSFLWWNWEVDEDQYPNWPGLIQSLKARGIRVMTYMNPFLVDVAKKAKYRSTLLNEAAAGGLLVQNADGCPEMVTSTAWKAAIVDVSNPQSRSWLRNIIKRQILDAGVSGWMADFGESLPFDAQIFAPEGAAAFHNRFPEEWARIAREATDESEHGSEVVFFTRSGFTRSPGIAKLFWLGDQMTNWDENDGLASAITGMVSGGMSGFALNHGDIGGYTAIDYPVVRTLRTKELFQRWAEFAAFTAAYRTHEGSLPEKNHQYDSDPDTLAHFSKFARVFRALAPYRKVLMQEAWAKGMPIVRPLFLHYPNDRNVYALRHQFMLGAEYLIAPVTEPGATSVTAYVPTGDWVNVWDGSEISSVGAFLDLPAPVGQPAVYAKKGSVEGARFAGELARLGAPLLPLATVRP